VWNDIKPEGIYKVGGQNLNFLEKNSDFLEL
jgi:hypothetical protein